MIWPPDTFWEATLATLVFGIMGIALTLFGFKLFDWITPHIDLERELAEKNNIAVAIVCGSVILGIAIVMAAAVG